MIKVETERLLIYPIDDEAMSRLIAAEPNAELKQAYREMLDGCLRDHERRQWYAVWLMVLKDESKTVVGDLSFKGLNDDGMVEIGYGLRDGSCGKGYMTEAVKAMAAWALAQNGVTRVEAETEETNLPSQRVLMRAGFVSAGIRGEEGPRFLYIGCSGEC